MNESIKDKAEYLVIFTNEFASQYHVAHTQGFETMVEDMATYCRRFGGAIK